MVALVQYMAVSTLAASVVVYHAFATRQHFFPATLYLSSSKVAAATIGNLAFASALLLHKLVIKLFLGALRDSEREMIQERLSSAVMESLLALTIFREEFSAFFVVMFASLVFIKVLHWLVQGRVDYAEVTPSISLLQHLRITCFLAFLLLLDSLLLQHTVTSSIASNGQTVMLLFAFEYVIQASNVVRYALKYGLSMIDLAWEGRWEHKGTAVFYLELVTDLLHLSVYVVFFVIVFMHYGLPLHLMRDLYSTFNNFRSRIQQFLRFRQVTARLDRFPDATPADLERCAGVCIICREDMGPGGPNKRLSCGHVFHINCLRSWLGQQQICPTCRASVFRPPPAVAAAPAAPAAAGAAAMAADGAAAAVPAAGHAAVAGAAAAAAPVAPRGGGWPAPPAAPTAAAAPAPAAAPPATAHVDITFGDESEDDELPVDQAIEAELQQLRARRAEREGRPAAYRAAIVDAAARLHRAAGNGGPPPGPHSAAGAAAPAQPGAAGVSAAAVVTELQALMDLIARSGGAPQAPAWSALPTVTHPHHLGGTNTVWVLQPSHSAGVPGLAAGATPEQQAAAAAAAAVAAVFGLPAASASPTAVSHQAGSHTPATATTSPPHHPSVAANSTAQVAAPAASSSGGSATTPIANLVASLVATQSVMARQLQQLAALVSASEAAAAAATAVAVAASVAAVSAAAAAAAAAAPPAVPSHPTTDAPARPPSTGARETRSAEGAGAASHTATLPPCAAASPASSMGAVSTDPQPSASSTDGPLAAQPRVPTATASTSQPQKACGTRCRLRRSRQRRQRLCRDGGRGG
ncbi:MAG: hypothetical protein WDW36_007273 [Sanguina aurantia]